MKTSKFLVFLLVIGMILTACAPVAVPGPTPGNVQAETPVQGTPAQQTPEKVEKTVVNAVIAALLKDINLGADQVQIISVEAVEWPNACLGAQTPDEMCAEVITPGYKIVLQAGGKTYEYHTNQDGSQIRLFGDSAQSETPAASLPAAATAAQQALARQLGIAAEQIQVVRIEPVDWPNGCLGIEQPGMMCTQAIVPGYRVTLEAAGKQYEFRTDETGNIALPAATPASLPLPQIAGEVMVWEQAENSGCSRAEVGTQSVTFGACGGSLAEAALADERAEELVFFMSTYQSFSVETQAGKVEFKGTGAQEASEAEMRSMAEWVALVAMEAGSGQADDSEGLALTWHREGGIAGFCDDLAVYRSGWALPRSCKISQAREDTEAYRLSAGELEKLYAWVDQLESFDYQHQDAASADAMLVRLSLAGTGDQQATTTQKEEIAVFAGQLYANAVNK